MSFLCCLSCKECSRKFPIASLYVCDFCFGPLEVQYDWDAIRHNVSRNQIAKGPHTIWRYANLLPVSPEYAVELGVGMTPLLKADNLSEALGVRQVWIKNDMVNPTHSFKDRVVSVATAKARELGMDTLACASTGNLAGSTGAHGAKAGMKTYVFIPNSLEHSKVIGAGVFGHTVLVNGSYDDVNRLCSEIADSHNWAFVNINMRPYYSEGSKTLAFEIVEQLDWRAPQNIVVPVGSGSLFTKVWKGLKEFLNLGLIDTMNTKMHIAQAAGCAPVSNAFLAREQYPRPMIANTVAKSLAIGNPADGHYAISIAHESGGSAVAVPEEEIAEGILLLAQTEGIFAETAGGVAIATLKHAILNGSIGADEEAVVLITGSGLKTLEAVEQRVPLLRSLATIESFTESVLEGIVTV